MDKTTIFSIQPELNPQIYMDFGGITVGLIPAPQVEAIIDAIQWGLNLVITESPVISFALKTMFKDFALLKAFTDLEVDFVEKTPSEIYEAYTALLTTGIFNEIIVKCNRTFVNFFSNSFDSTLQDITDYRRSAAGVIDTIAGEANANTKTIEEAERLIQNPDTIQNVKELLKVADALSTPQE